MRLSPLTTIVFVAILATNVYSSQEINPIKSWGELNAIFKNLNNKGVVVSNLIANYGVEKDNVEGLNLSTGRFQLKATGLPTLFRFFYADINNDSEEEYILVSSSGTGEWLDIDFVFKEKNGRIIDIIDEVRPSLRKIFFKNPDSDPQDTAVFMYHGDFIMEEDGGKTYFTVIGPSGTWYDLNDDYTSVSKVEEDRPIFYKFLWDENKINRVSEEERHYVKEQDYDSKLLLAMDEWWLTLSDNGKSKFLKEIKNDK